MESEPTMMKRVLLLLSLALSACAPLIYDTYLGPRVHVRIVDQMTVQSECSKRNVGLHPALAYPLLTVLLGCTVGHANGMVEVWSVDSAGALLHELDHTFNNKRCHDLLGRPATCS